MRRTILVLAVLAAGVALPAVACAFTHEVTRAGQLDTLIGTTTLQGTAHGGDRIHIQRGLPYRAPAGGWMIRKPLEIFGDGPGAPFNGDTASTWLEPSDTANPVLVVDLAGYPGQYLPNLYIHDLAIGQGIVPPASPNSKGIVCVNPSGKNLVSFRLARVSVFNMGDDGIHLTGADTGTGAIVGVSFDDCHSGFNRGNGLRLLYATVVKLEGGGFSNNWKAGASISGCSGVHTIRQGYEGNQISGTGWPNAQLFLESSHNFLVSGGHFEGFIPNGPQTPAISLSGCLGGYIVSSNFGNETGVTGSTGILVANGTKSVVVGPNSWSAVDILVSVDDTTTKSCTILPQAIYSSEGVASKIVVPDATDKGHIIFPPTGNTSNITAGIEFPRLTAATRNAMASPASGGSRREGLFVYNDGSKRASYWDGSQWREAAAYFPGAPSSQGAPAGINLPAVLTSTNRDSIPASFKVKGALFYNNSTNMLNFWNGTQWKEISVKNGGAP